MHSLNLIIDTPVHQSVSDVWRGFDRQLFDQLSPPFPPVDVIRFDGCLRGDVVHLRLNFLLFKQDWTSDIIDQQTLKTGDSIDEIFFIDKGVKLPFFLKFWQHRHRLLRNESDGTIIRDDITFSTPFWLLNYLMYPLMWVQFAYRKPIYRKRFGLSAQS